MREASMVSGGRARDLKSLPSPQSPLPTRVGEQGRRAKGQTFLPLL
jgi:hypothetical protein